MNLHIKTLIRNGGGFLFPLNYWVSIFIIDEIRNYRKTI